MAEIRLDVLFEPERTGASVAEVCRRHGISRQSFYEYRRRYLRDGVEALHDQSRRPLRSPAQMPEEIEDAICRMRKDHHRWGARRIRAELTRAGFAPPAVSSIHQALRRNSLVAIQAPRKPKADQRFERDISNDLWQIDATEVRLRDQRRAWIMDMIDDHSRYLLAAEAVTAPTAEAAWDCFEMASSRYGLPRQLLSDNGLCFTGRLHGVEVAFERSVRDLGVQLINSGPYHPQTLGKLERFHKTLKTWLFDEGPASDLNHLQELLDAFRHHYNKVRPHQGIGDRTPAERFGLADVSPIPEHYLTPEQRGYPPNTILRKVSKTGAVQYRRRCIIVGARWKEAVVRIVEADGLVHIYRGEELVRALVIDPNERYQRLTNNPKRRRVRKPVR